MVSDLANNEYLSLPARLTFYFGLPITATSLLAVSPITAALSSLVAAAPAILLGIRSHLPLARRGNLETVVWTFVGAGTIGLVGILTAQTGLSYACGGLIFGSQWEGYWKEFTRTTLDGLSSGELAKRTRMASSWRYVAFLLVFSLCLAGIPEETMKYVAVLWARRRHQGLRKQEYINYALAAGLGFGAVENIGFIYAASLSQPAVIVASTVIERMVISMPGHALMSCLTAINAVRRDKDGEPLKLWQVLGPSVLYHGVFDFAMFAVSAVEGNVGWVHPTTPSAIAAMIASAGGLFLTLTWHVWWRWSQIEWDEPSSE